MQVSTEIFECDKTIAKPSSLETVKFSEPEIDTFMDKIGEVLMETFNDSMSSYLAEKNDGKVMNSPTDMFGFEKIEATSKSRLFLNLCWAFDLFASQVPCSYAWCCATKDEPEHPEPTLAFLAIKLANELRELVHMVSQWDHGEGVRVAAKLAPYIQTTVYKH